MSDAQPSATPAGTGYSHTHCLGCDKPLRAKRDWSPTGRGQLRWTGHAPGCYRNGLPPNHTPAEDDT